MEAGTRNPIWVYVDGRSDRLLGLGLHVLGKARQLAASSGTTTAAVLVDHGKTGDEPLPPLADCVPVTDAAQTCIEYGADRAFILDVPHLTVPRGDVCGSALAEAVKQYGPSLVLFALTDLGREIAATTAMLCDSGLIADCADLTMKEGQVVARCPSWGGRVLADITFSDDRRTGFATVQPHIAPAERARGTPGHVERISMPAVDLSKGPQLISSRPEPAADRKLEQADVVVVGGAGLGNVEGFGWVRQLASALGGEVGATRPPVLQHWVDEERLIGQTGKTVRPKLLISVGTSGAVQYTAGIAESEVVVAINRDRHAPIFQVADIGIVADWKAVLPLLTERVRRESLRELADVWGQVPGEEVSGFGSRIRKLREGQEWTRETLAEKTGQSPEFILQVENEEVTPPVGFLLRLSRALGVDPGTFLDEREKQTIRDRRAEAFVKRTENYSYETLTPEAESEHLRAFMITIESKQAHKPVAYKHEGEEFVFVMAGELELTLGGKAHCLKPGESIRFNSDIPHKLKNLSDVTTRCLVVLYTP